MYRDYDQKENISGPFMLIASSITITAYTHIYIYLSALFTQNHSEIFLCILFVAKIWEISAVIPIPFLYSGSFSSFHSCISYNNDKNSNNLSLLLRFILSNVFWVCDEVGVNTLLLFAHFPLIHMCSKYHWNQFEIDVVKLFRESQINVANWKVGIITIILIIIILLAVIHTHK